MVDRGGFSLVELVVALGLTAVLGAGLLAFLAGGLGGLGRTAEALSDQMRLRRALDTLGHDLQEAGFLLPCRAVDPPDPPVRVRKDRPLGAAGGRTDELILLRDSILAEGAELAASLPLEDPPGPSRSVTVRSPERVRLLPGDLLVVEDDRWEAWRVVGALEVPPDWAQAVAVVPLDPPGVPRDHSRGAPVLFLRPLRRVIYALAPGAGGEPCLVRGETSLEAGEDRIRALLGGRRGPGDAFRVVAEGITAFRVAGEGPRVEVEMGARRRTVSRVRVPP